MVNDTLECIKNEITLYTNVISDSDNIEFRQSLQTVRNSLESFYFELLNLATSKGYYTKTPKIKTEEIEKIKSILL